MSKKALVIIAQDRYQDVELGDTRKGLLEANFEVVLCSKEVGRCSGKLGGTEEATIAMRDVQPLDYERYAFIGGPGARALRDDPEATLLAQSLNATGRPLGAICIAPTILAAAGVLEGKRATVWNEDGEQDAYISERGANYTAEDVTVDGHIVTANGPEAAYEFGQKLASL